MTIISQRPLSREREAELVARYKAGNRSVANIIIASNEKLLYRWANKYKAYNVGAEFDDLVQCGRIGLFKALDKFDESRGVRYISYATWWAKAYMLNHVMETHSLVKLGTTQVQKTVFLWRARLDDEQLAKKLGIDTNEVKEIRTRIDLTDFYHDATIPNGIVGALSMPFIENYADHTDTQEHLVVENDYYERALMEMRKFYQHFSGHEKFVLRHRLASADPKSLAELGRRVSLSRERVRQIETRLIRRLKKHLLQAGVKPPTLQAGDTDAS